MWTGMFQCLNGINFNSPNITERCHFLLEYSFNA